MLKLLSLFSGIGAFEKALENISEPFEVVRYCEIDKYASKAYSLIHNLDENMNLKDVTKVDTSILPNDIDIITYGFPCQDISLSGKQKGFTNDDGSLTRSGLFFEALDIIEETKPKIAIAENVKALTSKKFTAEFKIVLDSLNDAGYKNYWAVLNSKDYGIPQNRERVFIISIRNDIDHGFQFPAKYELKLRLKDLLEETVDEKYYLSDKMLDYITSTGTKNFYYKPEIDLEIARPLMSTMHKTHKASNDNYVSDSFVKNGNKVHIQENGQLSLFDYLPIKEATKKGYKEAHDGDYVNLQYPDSETRRGRVGEQCANTLLCNDAQGVVIKKTDSTICLNSKGGRNGVCGLQPSLQDRIYDSNGIACACSNFQPNYTDGLRIRKLTPKECFRLMGFDDKDCDILVANKISNTQLYKMAGNSIVVDVLEEIFVELLNQYEDVFPMAEG